MVCVYFTIWFLLPKYLTRRHYGLFIVYTAITIIACAILEIYTGNLAAHLIANRSLNDPSWVRIITTTFDYTIHTFFFIGFAVIGNWFEKDRRNMTLEKERLEAELVFLRAQMNPHFIFNALNSIYVLISEDKKQASDALLKFSALLRYQLYDCSEERMPVEKEIEFLKNYIQLETLRNSSGVDISFNLKSEENSLQIAPFILQPFVENAFKHVSRFKDQPNSIRIEAETKEDSVRLMVINTFESNSKGNSKGIGLRNVKRRLELLYPQKYNLQILNEDNVHIVNLLLNVNPA
jgi:LytS/YehU family sensor histidine kinase